MIDELPTRAALTVAAFAILAAGLAIVAVPGRDAVREAAQDLADHVAAELDLVSAIEGELRLRNGEEGFRIPERIAGEPYLLGIGASFVRVRAGGLEVVAPLRTRIHVLEPTFDAITPEALAQRDDQVLTLRPPDPFVVERSARWVAAEPTYLTFVYLPR